MIDFKNRCSDVGEVTEIRQNIKSFKPSKDTPWA